jgi:hypothetical protein
MTKTEDPNRASTLALTGDIAEALQRHPAPWRHSSDADPEILVDADGRYIVEMPTAGLAQLVATAVNAYAAPGRALSHLVDDEGDKWWPIGGDRFIIAGSRQAADEMAQWAEEDGQVAGNRREYIEGAYGPVGEVYER